MQKKPRGRKKEVNPFQQTVEKPTAHVRALMIPKRALPGSSPVPGRGPVILGLPYLLQLGLARSLLVSSESRPGHTGGAKLVPIRKVSQALYSHSQSPGFSNAALLDEGPLCCDGIPCFHSVDRLHAPD